MTPIQIGDRVVIAGSHFAAGREGSVLYADPLFGRCGVKVGLVDEEDCAPFIEAGSGAWLIKNDGPVVMPERYVVVPISHLEIDPAQVKPGDTVNLPECAGRWSHLVGIIARVRWDTCWIRLPLSQLAA